jgi:glutamyl-tRNA synthetase
MILNPQGKKLSKRDGAMDVMEYKKMGYLPEAVLNFLIRLGWSHGDQEIFSFAEMLEHFDPSNINRSASAYNPEKLDWLNAHYIKNSSWERIIEELKFFDLHIHGHDRKELIVDSLRERAKTLKEFADMARTIIEEPTNYDEKAVKKFINDESIEILEKYVEFLKNYQEILHLPSAFEKATKLFMEENGIKMKQLAQPIRIAMVGSAVSPSVYDVLSIVVKNDVIKRIEILITYIKG